MLWKKNQFRINPVQLTFYSSKNLKYFTVSTKHINQQKLFPALIIIRTIANNWVPIIIEQQNSFRMISEGSCDTEVWSHDPKNSAFHHKNKLHFQIYLNIKQLYEIVIIFHNITVCFDQTNATLVSTRDISNPNYWILIWPPL